MTFSTLHLLLRPFIEQVRLTIVEYIFSSEKNILSKYIDEIPYLLINLVNVNKTSISYAYNVLFGNLNLKL